MKKMLFLCLLIALATTACGPVTPIVSETLLVETTTPSRTPRPTFTPFLTLTPFTTPGITSYEIPSWLKMPGDHILMLTLIDNAYSSSWAGPYNQVLFLDVDTGKQYQMVLDNFVNAYWQDNGHVVFVHGDYCPYSKYKTILDLSSGKLTRYRTSNPEEDLCPPSMQKIAVGVSFMEREPPVYIYDTRRETSEDFWPPADGWVNANAEISWDYQTLVVLQYFGSFDEKGRFLIYEFANKELKGIYDVQNANRYFTFTSDSANVIFLEENMPCVLNLKHMTRKCGVPIPNDYKGIHPVGLSKDDSKLLFLHRGAEDEAFVGGLCIADIFTGDLNCPMAKLGYLRSVSWNEFYISDFEFSPDEKYIIFNYGGGCPTCDFYGGEGTAIVDLSGNLLLDLKANYYFEWRPMP